MRLVEVSRSTFNTRFRVELDDGFAVEAVHYRGDTLCVSSQVGCAVRCPFCASGAEGLLRQLSLDELWGQVEAVQQQGLLVERVTVSGVGEPLHNHRAVRELVLRCRERRIAPSLTTSGGPIERLKEWLDLPHNGLTISVHAGTEAMRARMVPKGPALSELFGCLRDELPKLSRSRRKKVALAYLLIADESDADSELEAFAELAHPLGVQVHLYAHNAVPTSQHRGVTRERYELAYAVLTARGLKVRMSSQARIEANGGCGTLVVARNKPKPS
ncbi:MAG: radical SAM protein [Myxococcales bacterium]